MRITFKREEHHRGLARVCQGPRGWKIRIDGVDVGSINRIFRKHKEEPPCSSDPLYVCIGVRSGCPHINTCYDKLFDTLDEAKAFAKAYILEHLGG